MSYVTFKIKVKTTGYTALCNGMSLILTVEKNINTTLLTKTITLYAKKKDKMRRSRNEKYYALRHVENKNATKV